MVWNKMNNQLLEIFNAYIILFIYFSFYFMLPLLPPLSIHFTVSSLFFLFYWASPPPFSSFLSPSSFLFLLFLDSSFSFLLSHLRFCILFLLFACFLPPPYSFLLCISIFSFLLSTLSFIFSFFFLLLPFSSHCPSDLLNMRNLQIREMWMQLLLAMLPLVETIHYHVPTSTWYRINNIFAETYQ